MHVSLEGYVVRRTTEKAVGLAKSGSTILHDDLTWVPRSVCEDGDALAEGDTDITVAEWFADKEGLDY